MTLAERLRMEGMQQGMQQGMQKGLQQGMRKKENDIALNMLKSGYSVEEVSKLTGLSVLKIKLLAKTIE